MGRPTGAGSGVGGSRGSQTAAAVAAAAHDVSVQTCIIFDRRGGQLIKYGQLAKREQ